MGINRNEFQHTSSKGNVLVWELSRDLTTVRAPIVSQLPPSLRKKDALLEPSTT